MSEQPSDQQPPDRHPDLHSLADSFRAKMEEYDVERHLDELATTLEGAVRQGMAKAGELVHDHRGDIDRLLDKAAGLVDRHTEGKHADTITQVRGSLDRGVERLADQRDAGPPQDGPGGDVPPSNG